VSEEPKESGQGVAPTEVTVASAGIGIAGGASQPDSVGSELAGDVQDARPTMRDLVPATPAYMAPEQSTDR
jgi:hypothetical protein